MTCCHCSLPGVAVIPAALNEANISGILCCLSCLNFGLSWIWWTAHWVKCWRCLRMTVEHWTRLQCCVLPACCSVSKICCWMRQMNRNSTLTSFVPISRLRLTAMMTALHIRMTIRQVSDTYCCMWPVIIWSSLKHGGLDTHIRPAITWSCLKHEGLDTHRHSGHFQDLSQLAGSLKETVEVP